MSGSTQGRTEIYELAPPLHLRAGVQLLLQAHYYAEDVGRDPWEFAVELSDLRRCGLSQTDLRWLVCRGYLAHASEVRAKGGSVREFRSATGLRFPKSTCFRLTPEGIEFALEFVSQMESEANRAIEENSNPERSDEWITPRWDGDRHQLRLGDVIVKEFKVPSPNQEAILAAFEEEGWPPRIDDPLAPIGHMDSKRRLHDTIKNLNRNQKRQLISFLGDGTGQGVRWELTSSRRPAPKSLEADGKSGAAATPSDRSVEQRPAGAPRSVPASVQYSIR